MLVSVGKYTIHGWYGISLLDGQGKSFFFGGGDSGSITRESAIEKNTHSYSKEVSPLP